MFAVDRDLLMLEPTVFRDVAWTAQRVVNGTGSVAGTTLTLTFQDVDLASAGVEGGHVALVDGVAYEVVERQSATTATISRVRALATDPVITPSPATAKPVSIVTFRPQLAIVHAQVLRMLGIEPGVASAASVVGEGSITNPEALRLAEALGALHLVYSAAAALSPVDSPAWARAELYRERFARERQRVVALIDVDGDGKPDARRRMNLFQLERV